MRVLAEELRRTLPEIDRIEKELGKAAKAIQSVRRWSCATGNGCANSATLPRVADQRPPQNGTAVCLVLRNSKWRETDDD